MFLVVCSALNIQAFTVRFVFFSQDWVKRVKMIEGQRALFDVTGRHDEGDQLPSYESSHDWMEHRHVLYNKRYPPGN